MAERLWIPAYPLRKADLADFPHAALVDTQPPFRNNRYPPLRHPDILIDHHGRHPRTGAELLSVDESVGATTTLLGEALLLSGVSVPRRLATAIVYGIGSETQNLGRETSLPGIDPADPFHPQAATPAVVERRQPLASGGGGAGGAHRGGHGGGP